MDGTPYGQSTLLNEIHTYFPALLYDGRRFNSVRDVFSYVDQQMSMRFNVYSNQRAAWQAQEASSRAFPSPGHVPRRHRQQVQRPQVPVPVPIVVPPPQEYQLDPLTRLFLATIVSQPNANFMEPVRVTATPEQIARASTLTTESSTSDSPCAICQDTIAVGDRSRRLHACNHYFHQTCIDTWFQRNVHCPVCRHDIRTSVQQTAFSRSLQQGLSSQGLSQPHVS